MSSEKNDSASNSAGPKGSDRRGEFSANPKGSGQELSKKSMFPKGGGGKDEASVQPKTAMPEKDTVIPPANRD